MLVALADRAHRAEGGDVEDVHGQRLLVGEHEGAGVHDPDVGREGLLVRQVGEPDRVGVVLGIGVVDAVHPVLGDEQRVRVQLERPLNGRVVGGHVGLADAARQHDDEAALEVVHRAQPDERLGDAVDRHRGHHPHVRVGPRGERAAQHERVHDRAEHADVVGLGPADPPAVGHPAAEVVPAADHDRDLHAEVVHGQHLVGDPGEAGGIGAGSGGPGQGLAAELDHHSAVSRQRQGPFPYEFSGGHAIRPRGHHRPTAERHRVAALCRPRRAAVTRFTAPQVSRRPSSGRSDVGDEPDRPAAAPSAWRSRPGSRRPAPPPASRPLGGDVHEQLVVEAEHDPRAERRRPGPDGDGPHLEQLGGGPLDHRVAPVPAAGRSWRRPAAPAPRAAGHPDQPPAVGAQVLPGLRGAVGGVEVAHGDRVSGPHPPRRPAAVPGRLPVHRRDHRDLGGRPVDAELGGHREVHVVGRGGGGERGVAGDGGEHPGLDLPEVGPDEQVPGLGDDRPAEHGGHVVQPARRGHPPGRPVAAGPGPAQPAVRTEVPRPASAYP